jgi:chromate transporter
MTKDHESPDKGNDQNNSPLEVFLVFLRLGLTSFGGPVAHLGYFRDAFVQRLKWLDDQSYADIVAVCQFLPGPASSQVGIAVGQLRAGFPGALAAWLGFTLPSALLLALFGMSLVAMGDGFTGTWLHGLKVVAVAVVAQAVWGMGRNLAPDAPRATLAVVAAAFTVALPGPAGQVGAILLGGLIGAFLLPAGDQQGSVSRMHFGVSMRAGVISLVFFFLLLIGLPVIASLFDNTALSMFDSFYRAGSLVFGGGHVVLPLLESEVVPPGWVSDDAFLAGYGAAQAVPGPLFTFAAYLGAVSTVSPTGAVGAILCLVAVFLPSFLLVIGVLPLWGLLRSRNSVGRAMRGINAAVVGLLLAALYNPVWTYGVKVPMDFVFVLAAYLALDFWKVPPWLVVILGGLIYGFVG